MIRSKPGALWQLHLLIASFTSVRENGVIGSVIGHALSKNVLMTFLVLLLSFVCGVLNTLERYVPKAVALSLSV